MATERSPLSDVSRDPRTRVLGGVCSAVGRSTGTGPVLWRLVVVLLSLSGGGLVLYAAGWLFLPDARTSRSIAQQLFRARRYYGRDVPAALLALSLPLLVLSSARDTVVALFAAALVYYLIVRRSPLTS